MLKLNRLRNNQKTRPKFQVIKILFTLACLVKHKGVIKLKDKETVIKLIANLKSQMTTNQELKLVVDFELQIFEEWRDVEGYEGLYQVSNMGRIRSLRYGRTYIVKNQHNDRGYCYISLHKNGKGKHYFVHILVAKAFIANPEGKKQVNHIDANKSNNCVENLEWVTQEENLQHAYKNGLIKIGSSHHCSQLTEEQVRYIRQNYTPYDKEFGRDALAKKFGVRKKVIYNVAHNITYKHVC